MRHLTIAIATVATLGLAATLSAARADSYYGPKKVGDQCWHHTLGNSFGYWGECKPEKARAQAIVRPARRR